MFSLWMFGGLIERTLGAKRFLIYYMVCGIGAGICQELWQTADYFIEGMYAYDMVNTGSSLMPMGLFLNQWTTMVPRAPAMVCCWPLVCSTPMSASCCCCRPYR